MHEYVRFVSKFSNERDTVFRLMLLSFDRGFAQGQQYLKAKLGIPCVVLKQLNDDDDDEGSFDVFVIVRGLGSLHFQCLYVSSRVSYS